VIGILGGTFDPVHFGHLRPALEIHEALGLDEVRLVPCLQPPHRPQPVASGRQRLAMLQAAVMGHPAFSIDERELGREGPSYTFDTLVSLKEEPGNRSLCLMIGMDAFRGLPTWHRWHELIDLCHMVVMTRPGAEPPGQGELADFVKLHRVRGIDKLGTQASGLLLFHNVTHLDISGTQIRKLLSAGRDAEFLIPAGVYDIIRREGLYTD